MHRRGDHIVSVATPPVASPVSLSDMKAHLRVTHGLEDQLIDGYITSAMASLDRDGELGRAISTQTIDEAFQYPPKDVYLKVTPVQALVSVKYFDAANDEQTATLSDFTLYTSDDWAFVRSDSWPATYDRPDAITVQYTAGYITVPAGIVHAIKMIVAHWYENRSDTSEVALTDVPRAAAHLISLHRSGWYG